VFLGHKDQFAWNVTEERDNVEKDWEGKICSVLDIQLFEMRTGK